MFHRRISSLPDTFWSAAMLVLVVISAGACGSAAKQAQATTPATSRAAPHSAPMAAADVPAQGCAVEPVYFAYDSSALDERARDTLSRNAACLRRQRSQRVKLVGMTDERGTEEYNAALGERRARAAAQYLASLGIEEQRMLLHSMGEELATGRDEQGWAGDRRAQLDRD